MDFQKIKFDSVTQPKLFSSAKIINKKTSLKTVKGICMAGLMALSAVNMACVKNNKSFTGNLNTEAYISNENFNNSYKRYGEYYLNNIPDIEHLNEHKYLIKELSALSDRYQGCEIKNPAYLNGLSVKDLQRKVIEPAKKLADNIHFGENQKTLALIGFETGLDDKVKAFEKDFQNSNFSNNFGYLGGVTPISFDKSFFDNYDNIILIQPNKQNCDKTLDTVFEKINNTLDKGANIDIAIVGHGTSSHDGIRLSKGKNETSAFDVSDFASPKSGGNSYAQNIRKMFLNSMEKGYTPRIIGLGCNSEFLQDCMDKIFSYKDLENIKVFGTPSEIMDSSVLGFYGNQLNVYSLTTGIKDDIGLVINISENKDLKSENNKNVKNFKINENLANEIYNDYISNNQTSGTLSKSGDMIMEYQLMQIR